MRCEQGAYFAAASRQIAGKRAPTEDRDAEIFILAEGRELAVMKRGGGF
ncbi:hypothetical protein [Pseudomonas petrae]|nr:hypothetical protein [Pseudomonas petrae]MCF7535234.1 hypothetical protein [Pseudomonas petrae]MCF7558534.1 hypothetical protein [Pseudomonas petrae]